VQPIVHLEKSPLIAGAQRGFGRLLRVRVHHQREIHVVQLNITRLSSLF